MSKSIYTICFMVAFTLFSCKDASKETEAAKEEKKETTIRLSNYTDTNWTAGVGVEFDMFLVDNSKANEEIIKTAKELELTDGTIIKVTGYKVAEPFIQINVEGKASDYKEAAGYPNDIVVK